jgi:hypothetical protein
MSERLNAAERRASMPRRSNVSDAGHAAFIAAKAGGRAVPYAGEALMLIEGAPVLLDELSKATRDQKATLKEYFALLKAKQYRAAAAFAAKHAISSNIDSWRAQLRVLSAALVGKELADELKMKPNPKKPRGTYEIIDHRDNVIGTATTFAAAKQFAKDRGWRRGDRPPRWMPSGYGMGTAKERTEWWADSCDYGIVLRATRKNPREGSIFRAGQSEGKETRDRRRAAKTHTKGVGRVGESDFFSTIRGSRRSEMTPTGIFEVLPNKDPDGKGYFILVYDPRRRASVERITNAIGGWVSAPSITHVEYESLVEVVPGRGGTAQRIAPATHRVISLGRGQHAVVGPRAKQKDVFGTRGDADTHAKELDVLAASQLIPEKHWVNMGAHPGTFVVNGPRVDDVEIPDVDKGELIDLKEEAEGDWAAYERARDAAPRGTKIPFQLTSAQQTLKDTLIRGPFLTRGEAERQARALDRMEASSGATPLAAKRTKPSYGAKKAAQTVTETVASFFENGQALARFPDLKRMSTFMSVAARDVDTESVAAERRRSWGRAPMPRVAKPSEIHNLTYKEIRDALVSEGFDAAEIEEVIADERHNRAAVKAAAARLLELEPTRVGRPKLTRATKRKDLKPNRGLRKLW